MAQAYLALLNSPDSSKVYYALGMLSRRYSEGDQLINDHLTNNIYRYQNRTWFVYKNKSKPGSDINSRYFELLIKRKLTIPLEVILNEWLDTELGRYRFYPKLWVSTSIHFNRYDWLSKSLKHIFPETWDAEIRLVLRRQSQQKIQRFCSSITDEYLIELTQFMEGINAIYGENR